MKINMNKDYSDYISWKNSRQPKFMIPKYDLTNVTDVEFEIMDKIKLPEIAYDSKK